MTPIRKRNIAYFASPLSVGKITPSFSVSARLIGLPRWELYRQLDFATDAIIHHGFKRTEILDTIQGHLMGSMREL